MTPHAMSDIDQLAAKVQDLQTSLGAALERIRALERAKEADEDYRREMNEREG